MCSQMHSSELKKLLDRVPSDLEYQRLMYIMIETEDGREMGCHGIKLFTSHLLMASVTNQMLQSHGHILGFFFFCFFFFCLPDKPLFKLG